MNLIKSFVLGIVQGLTEFLPISSTAHLRIIPSFLKWEDPGTIFSAIIQFGTVFSVVIFFWKDLTILTKAFLNDLFLFLSEKNKSVAKSTNSKLVWWIGIGTIPICVFGLLFKDPLENGVFRNLNLIALYLIYFGAMLLFSEFVAKKNRDINSIKLLDVFLIGLTQAFSLVPGASRSGVTIMAGLLIGFKRADAAKFSFLLGLPATILSGLLELYTLIKNLKSGTEDVVFLELLIGLLSAFISGYWAIGFLLKYLQTHKTYIFIIYRFLLGLAIIYLFNSGIIK